MPKFNSFMEAVPSWIVSFVLAIVTSYTAVQIRVNTLETKAAELKERVSQIDNSKANKELFQESTRRLDRIELKLDRIIESKQQ